MYSVNRKKKVTKKMHFVNTGELEKASSFLMPTKAKGFKISDQVIRNVRIFEVVLARVIVTRVVDKKYRKLIASVTELLVSDDDSGDSFRLALTEMEKFRQEVKNKYRIFLEQEELNFMAKQISTLQKEAKNRFVELQNSFMMSNSTGKNR